jgi:hypothetical protein
VQEIYIREESSVKENGRFAAINVLSNITVLPFAAINDTAAYQGRRTHANIEVTSTGPVTRTALTDNVGSFARDQLRAGSCDIVADADR